MDVRLSEITFSGDSEANFWVQNMESGLMVQVAVKLSAMEKDLPESLALLSLIHTAIEVAAPRIVMVPTTLSMADAPQMTITEFLDWATLGTHLTHGVGPTLVAVLVAAFQRGQIKADSLDPERALNEVWKWIESKLAEQRSQGQPTSVVQ